MSGTFVMMQYSQSAGAASQAPQHWPRESSISRSADRTTLLMFVHPQCPCSSASLGELERLLAHASGRLDVHLLFLKPEGFAPDWAHGRLWEKASAIPGITLHLDEGGGESARFHALTSGQTLLYDRQGTLAFEGGITAARGHAGDSAGQQAVLSLLEGKLSLIETPVFGCALGETGEAL